MVMELSDKFSQFEEKTIEIIKNNFPIELLKYKSSVINVDNIETDFEHKVKVLSRFSIHKEFTEDYSITFVFDKDYNFIKTADSNWVKDSIIIEKNESLIKKAKELLHLDSRRFVKRREFAPEDISNLSEYMPAIKFLQENKYIFESGMTADDFHYIITSEGIEWAES